MTAFYKSLPANKVDNDLKYSFILIHTILNHSATSDKLVHFFISLIWNSIISMKVTILLFMNLVFS